MIHDHESKLSDAHLKLRKQFLESGQQLSLNFDFEAFPDIPNHAA
jgi:hypothetical protein